MTDERTPQPQDDLSEDQLSEVSGGVGDPDRHIVVSGVPNEVKTKIPKEQQQGVMDGTSNTMMAG